MLSLALSSCSFPLFSLETLWFRLFYHELFPISLEFNHIPQSSSLVIATCQSQSKFLFRHLDFLGYGRHTERSKCGWWKEKLSIFKAKRIRKQFFVLASKGSKNDSSGTLKAAFNLPGGNVIPAYGSRVTQGGMRGMKGSLWVKKARQSL